MAAITPYIHNHLLISSDAHPDASFPLESHAWWDWLRAPETTTFRFMSPHGHFTARRESRQGNQYWYAYRKHRGKLTKAYLGRSEELTEYRLATAAHLLTQRAQSSHKNSHTDALSWGETDLLPQQFPHDFAQNHQDFLLMMKFVPAAIRTPLVERPRLVDDIQRAVQHTLTLLSAPAGSGKSTLLSLWYTNMSQMGDPVAWIGLEQADNDPARFWLTIIAAIQTLFPHIGQNALAVLRASHHPAYQNIVASLLHDLASLSVHFTLVLDDYHLIEASAIHSAFLFFLEHLPSHMHLVLSTRVDPPFPLARFRTRGQLAEIRTPALNFTFEETMVFFNHVMGFHLSLSEVTALMSRIEGWVAGLQLAALALQGRENMSEFLPAFHGSHHYLVDYLAEEVLNRQEEHIQRFLLSLSILERFTGPLCDALLEQQGSQTLLWNLERANMFLVPLDEQHQWYRYHALFAEFLQNRLFHTQNEQVPLLHRKAARWYEQQGSLRDAIHHLLAAPAYQQAALLIEHSCEAFMRQGETSTLLGWIEVLPQDVLRTKPYLSMYYAGLLASTDQIVAAEYHVQNAERVIRDMEVQYVNTGTFPSGENASELHDLQDALAVVRASLAGFRGDVAQAITLSQHAYARLAKEKVYLRSVLTASLGTAYVLSGNVVEATKTFLTAETMGKMAQYTHLTLVSACVQAYLLMEQGYLHQAANHYRQILQYTTEKGGPQHVAASSAYLGLGELHYYWNELDVAEHSLVRGLELGQQWESLASLTRGTLFLARIKHAHGETEEAFAALHQREHHALRLSAPHAGTLVSAIRATLWLAQDNVEAASCWLQGTGLSQHDELSYASEFIYLTVSQVFLATGEFEAATLLLSRLLERAEAEKRGRSILAIVVCQALLYAQQGVMDRALHALFRALSLAEPEGIVRVFVDHGAPMRALLTAALAGTPKRSFTFSPSSSYIHVLLAAFDQQAGNDLFAHQDTPQRPTSPSHLALTTREREVLQMVALGFSNQQIARELVIAPSTVKWYVKQLYTKLDSHNRTQVLMHARALHLL